MGKKYPGRFTIQFNLGDPQQERAAELLERQGRKKASFITDALLHYISCTETPDICVPPTVSMAEIEKIVLAVLEKQAAREGDAGTLIKPTDNHACEQYTAQATDSEVIPEDLQALLGNDSLAAITSTLAAFQGE